MQCITSFKQANNSYNNFFKLSIFKAKLTHYNLHGSFDDNRAFNNRYIGMWCTKFGCKEGIEREEGVDYGGYFDQKCPCERHKN